LAWSSYHLASAAAALALHPHDHNPLVEGHVAGSLTAAAFLRFSARFGLGPMAGVTGISAFVLECLVYSNYTFEVPFTA